MTAAADILISWADPFADGGAAAYAWAFGQGLLVDLTPCVYPLIPITVAVFGAKGVSRGRALFLATAYVMGMAALYTSLGIAVAMSGAAFGAWLGNPWVVIPIALLLVALAASMFGAFDLQLPTSLQNRLNTVGGAGPFGAFLMGLVSGLISAPCTGPVLLSLLAFIAKSSAAGGSVLYGGSLLFAYALGMGSLFFAVALGASLFRPGPWMEHVKSFFGIALLVMALWFLRPLSEDLENLILHPQWGLWLGMGVAAVGLLIGGVHLSFKGPGLERVRKGIGVAIATFGAIVAVNNVLYVPPMQWNAVATVDEVEQELREAQEAGKPILVDFAAKWCLPCQEIEKKTFHHETVEPRLARDFHLIKVDVTDPDDELDKIQAAFHGGTLPSVIVYESDAGLTDHIQALRTGTPLPDPTVEFHELVEAEEFLAALDGVD